MQNKILAAIVITLVLHSGIIIQSNIESDHRLSKHDQNTLSLGDSEVDFKIHQPGNSVFSPEKLIWSPNNLTEYSTMQLSIINDGEDKAAELEAIEISGFWISDSNDLYEQFRSEIDEFTVNEYAGVSIISENYTYPSSVLGGNYSIIVNLSFSQEDSVTIERRDVKFTIQDYHFGLTETDQKLTLCTCEKKLVELTVKNSGEDETDFSYSVGLNESQIGVKIEWSEISRGLSRGNLLAGESVQLEFKIQITESAQVKNDILEISIYLEVSYNGDDGETVYLADEEVKIEAMVLEGEVSPNAVVSISGFKENLTFNDGPSLISPNQLDTSFFTFENNYFMFNLSISNPGYYDSALSINPTNNVFDYRILSVDSNLTFNQFKDQEVVIDSQEEINYSILVLILGNYVNASIGFDIGFNQSFFTAITLNIAAKPQTMVSAFANTPPGINVNRLPAELTNTLQINLAPYENFLFFNNDWFLKCNHSSEVTLMIIAYGAECHDQPILLDYTTDTTILDSFEIRILIDEDYNEQLATINLSLAPAASHNYILHTLTLQIPIMIDNTTNDQNGGADNNETDGEEPGGGVVEPPTNSTNNENQTADDENETAVDLDRDGDGVNDALDNCPDSEANVAVDASGCKIVEQDVNTDESTDDNSQQNIEQTASKSSDDNTFVYVVIGAIAIIVAGVIIAVISKRSNKAATTVTKSIETIAPLPAIPLPNLEPVVLQQWTDANGYSWRQMSDQTIMWWNGSEWIPYGKN